MIVLIEGKRVSEPTVSNTAYNTTLTLLFGCLIAIEIALIAHAIDASLGQIGNQPSRILVDLSEASLVFVSSFKSFERFRL